MTQTTPVGNWKHEYPPEDWSVAELHEIFAATPRRSPLPTCGDSEVWTELRSDPLTSPVVDAVLRAASEAAGEPIPQLTASRFLEYDRTGDRSTYQGPERERTRRLSLFTLAECFDSTTSYIDDVQDYILAICEQTAWTLPAHLIDDDRGLPRWMPGDAEHVELHTSQNALLLAEVDHVLGDRLHPVLRRRIRTEVDSRVLRSYESRDFRWYNAPTNNHNAVCHAGIIGAALYLEEDPERLARLVQKAVVGLENYLAGFGPDGGNTEGVGYWNYGFGHYALLSSLLEERTDGEYSLLTSPITEAIARFPLRVELSSGQFPAISDASGEPPMLPNALCYLGRYFDDPALTARGLDAFRTRRQKISSSASFDVSTGDVLPMVLRDLLCARRVDDGDAPAPPKRDYLSGTEWWIVRDDPDDPDGLVVVAKGGHNAEEHNQNDCGAFIVHYRGESIVPDIGSPKYDRDYFSDERYEYLHARSLGHSVPVVNGYEQASNRYTSANGDYGEYSARVLTVDGDRDRDVFELDLAGCYPDEAGIASLRRRISLDRTVRPDGAVLIEDEATFADHAPGATLESVVVTDRPTSLEDGQFAVRGEAASVDVEFQPTDAEATIDELTDVEPGRDVWRARVAVSGEPSEAGDPTAAISLRVVPRST